jgi:hypothetical protein
VKGSRLNQRSRTCTSRRSGRHPERPPTLSRAPNGLPDRVKLRSCERPEARRGRILDVFDRGATKGRDANPRFHDGRQTVRCSSCGRPGLPLRRLRVPKLRRDRSASHAQKQAPRRLARAAAKAEEQCECTCHQPGRCVLDEGPFADGARATLCGRDVLYYGRAQDTWVAGRGRT